MPYGKLLGARTALILDLMWKLCYNSIMNVTDLYLSLFQTPFYHIKMGEYFSPDYPVYSYSDIMVKSIDCNGLDKEIYVGNQFNYELIAKSLVTKVKL